MKAIDRYEDKVSFMRLPFVIVLAYFFLYFVIFSFSPYYTVEGTSLMIVNSVMKLLFVMIVLYTIFGQYGVKGIKGNRILAGLIIFSLLGFESLAMTGVIGNITDKPFDAMMSIAMGKISPEIMKGTLSSWITMIIFELSYITFIIIAWLLTKIITRKSAYSDPNRGTGRQEEIELTAFLFAFIGVTFSLMYMPGKLPIDNVLKFILLPFIFAVSMYFIYLFVGSILPKTNFRILEINRVFFALAVYHILMLFVVLSASFAVTIATTILYDFIAGNILFIAIAGLSINAITLILYFSFEKMMSNIARQLTLFRKRTIRGIFLITIAVSVIVAVNRDFDNAYIIFSFSGLLLIISLYINWILLRISLGMVYGQYDGLDNEGIKNLENATVPQGIPQLQISTPQQ